MDTRTMELNTNEMEYISSGTFLPEAYSELEYGCVGIRVVKHTFLPNEYWWQGKNIGFMDSVKVVDFTANKGRQPYSMEECQAYINEKYGDDGKSGYTRGT